MEEKTERESERRNGRLVGVQNGEFSGKNLNKLGLPKKGGFGFTK